MPEPEQTLEEIMSKSGLPPEAQAEFLADLEREATEWESETVKAMREDEAAQSE